MLSEFTGYTHFSLKFGGFGVSMWYPRVWPACQRAAVMVSQIATNLDIASEFFVVTKFM